MDGRLLSSPHHDNDSQDDHRNDEQPDQVLPRHQLPHPGELLILLHGDDRRNLSVDFGERFQLHLADSRRKRSIKRSLGFGLSLGDHPANKLDQSLFLS